MCSSLDLLVLNGLSNEDNDGSTRALKSVKVSVGLDIDECIFNSILLNASKCMQKNIYQNNQQILKSKNDWFDQDCMVVRKRVKHDLRVLRKLRSCD